MSNRENFVDTALSFVGIREGSKGHKTLVDMYNKINPLPRGYHLQESDAWCAAFVSVCASVSGNLAAVPAECGCPEMVKAFRQRGEFYTDAAADPRPGDVLFYDWNGDGIADHVGIVVKVPDKTSIEVCEGNYNDSVGIRHIGNKNKSILGIAKPDFREIPDWKTEAIQFCIEHGISDGTNPNGTASRVEVMAMCARTYKAVLTDLLNALEKKKE